MLTPTAIAEKIIVMEGWRANLLAVAAGAASALALAPFHLWPILFFTMPIFVWLLDGAVAPSASRGLRRFWPAFRTGFNFGFGYFLAGLWWIGQAFLVEADEFAFLLPVAVIGLPILLALFWGVGAAFSRLAWRDGWSRLLAFACAITLAELARGHVWTGFPWNLPGYALMPSPLMMQSVGLVGAYGMTLVTLFITASPAIFAPGDGVRKRRVRAVLASALVLLVAHAGYGAWALSRATDDVVANVKLRLVQPNIDQREKWKPENAGPIFRSYLELSNTNAGPQANGANAFTHIIWPESAFPFILSEQQQALGAIRNTIGPNTTLISGAMRRESGDAIFNSALVINGEAQIVAARDKTQLVPFGEFLPAQSFLESMGFQQLTKQQGGFAQGLTRAPVSLPGAPAFLPLICYEVVYSGPLNAGEERPGWIVNLTNDAWFGNTSGPYQHAHQTRVRGVEQGIPIVRVANSGITFVSDAWGRIDKQLPFGARAVLDSDLPVAAAATPFSRNGNFPIALFVCILFFALVVLRALNTNRLQ
ncbi:apolipoprotein N-acyltransferase [Pseudahrensia aquimaris]|uniref:Apolipoprotein N-acyltransferase n=1 Tax=Pseudahrensia aquimaris TaxID=744461 RepID=A0ABW3FG05_9HYPH